MKFSNDEEAAEAIRQFNGYELAGRKLNVNAAEERPDRGSRRDGPPARRPEGFRRPDDSRPPPREMREPAPVSMDDGGDPDWGGDDGRSFKSKGSRRGLRARKRSL